MKEVPVPHLRMVGCRQHNLRNLSLTLPKEELVAITGVSGAGKSSLLLDTIFAEGQRRYFESLSMAARSSLKQMPRPEVDLVEGLSPTLAVGQGAIHTLPKSTVGTQTEIYDILSALYGHLGEQWSPKAGVRMERYTAQEMVEKILRDYAEGARLQLLAPLSPPVQLEQLQRMGFLRIRIDGRVVDLSEVESLPTADHPLQVVVDRFVMREGVRQRLSESVQLALQVGRSRIAVQEGSEGPLLHLSVRYICPETGESFEPLHPSDFNFHSSRAACPLCEGMGGGERLTHPERLFHPSEGVGEQVDLLLALFPKRERELIEQAWESWITAAAIDPQTHWGQLSAELQQELLYGSDRPLAVRVGPEGVVIHWKGWVEYIARDLQNRGERSRLSEMALIEWCECRLCHGGRLRLQALHCRLQGVTLPELCQLTIADLRETLASWQFTGSAERVARELLPGLLSRIDCLLQLGLDYLTLDRTSRSLSAGELQRVELATQIGSHLSGVLYLLDEPSAGLHRIEVERLIKTIHQLRALGNSVILADHDPLLLAQAGHLVELGPGAGRDGGSITFQGSYKELLADPTSTTGGWLSGREALPPHKPRKAGKEALKLSKVNCHNLRDFSIEIPLGLLVGFCGVSGSGKSTLVVDVVAHEIRKLLAGEKSDWLPGGLGSLRRLSLVDQERHAPSIRSIPATYIGAMTPLRTLFSETRLAKARGYSASHFSLNRRGGRCEGCEGLGQVRIPIDFLPDLWAPCELCNGDRYNYETLQVTWQGRSMADLLRATAAEAVDLFEGQPAVRDKLALMCELGLDYLELGQPFPTLSGGEIQRLELVAELAKPAHEPTLYLLDEPSAGLHFSDLEKLVKILHRLVDRGHSVWLIEHNLSLLNQCDWLVELGPGGGPAGGRLLFEGRPDQLRGQSTPTGQYI